ncbi:hypothetical protein D8Y22_08485 [Salinadaptatus halalkaliphilus]|uniref:Uncharacterized protein n=1 Tax=Salinadaptatus halalkaliphilus TaxID=2419781 RepID=A0A4V3VLD1_9EURY|nr:hypothetical protein [Salinadaptatus halalkaliphilus]THE65237.1 hypothetical protein D8Y22_08485 [Salinadaptatus halalkaliphilus]
MRVSIPGTPGIYYDTDAGSSALQVALTAAGRRAPKPKGYAIQLLPYLWSFDVDLREVPTEHPIQYLHPEGARSLGELSAERGVQRAGADLEAVLQFAWAVNREVESGANSLLGIESATEGVVIEIEDGSVGVDGDELETDAFDIDDSDATSADDDRAIDDGVTEFEIDTETGERERDDLEIGSGDDTVVEEDNTTDAGEDAARNSDEETTDSPEDER